DKVIIGPTSDVPYGAAHQLGFHGSVSVRGFRRRVASRNVFGNETVNGKRRRKKLASGITFVRPFARMMNLPARPYLVFRPEDPENIQKTLEGVIDRAGESSGLK
ncbi:MAG: hypothetical protein M3O85_07125, partial [Acidobacteriota bacterium]|nr:hypothetical protein [Acidobacteriota bacterium]